MELSALYCLVFVVSGCGAFHAPFEKITSDPCGDGCFFNGSRACGFFEVDANISCHHSREYMETHNVNNHSFLLGRARYLGNEGASIKLTMAANSTIRMSTPDATLHGEIDMREGAQLLLRGPRGLRVGQLTLSERSKPEVLYDSDRSFGRLNCPLNFNIRLAPDSVLSINATPYCEVSYYLPNDGSIDITEDGLNCNLTILRPDAPDFRGYPNLTLGLGITPPEYEPYYSFQCVREEFSSTSEDSQTSTLYSTNTSNTDFHRSARVTDMIPKWSTTQQSTILRSTTEDGSSKNRLVTAIAMASVAVAISLILAVAACFVYTKHGKHIMRSVRCFRRKSKDNRLKDRLTGTDGSDFTMSPSTHTSSNNGMIRGKLQKDSPIRAPGSKSRSMMPSATTSSFPWKRGGKHQKGLSSGKPGSKNVSTLYSTNTSSFGWIKRPRPDLRTRVLTPLGYLFRTKAVAKAMQSNAPVQVPLGDV